MGLIELEFTTQTFQGVIQLLISAAPLPTPTFAVLGSDRLISKLTWDAVTIAGGPPELAPPAGALLARADVMIGHASIAEFAASPTLQETAATAWLFVGVSASSGSPHRLTVDIVRIDVPGRPTTPPLSPPVRLGGLPTALDISLPDGVVAVAQAILAADDVCTVRFATSTEENLFAPPANRVKALEQSWALHVSGQVVAEQLRKQLQEVAKSLPADVQVEQPADAGWVQLLNGQWGAIGGLGLKKVNACDGPLGSPDLSVSVSAVLLLTEDTTNPDPAKQNTLTYSLGIKTDASDWDSFRCWLASGLGPLALVLVPPWGIDSIAAVGIRVTTAEGDALGGISLGGSWKKLAGDDTSASYEMTTPIPKIGPTIGDVPPIGPDGVVVAGPLTPFPADQVVVPAGTDGGALTGAWVGSFSCKKNTWGQTFELPYVVITETAQLGGQLFARMPVTIFATSTALPADQWSVEIVPDTPDQIARVISHATAAAHPTAGTASDPRVVPVNPSPFAKPTGHAFIHTSAGLKRFDLGPVPSSKAAPDDLQLIPMRVNCRNFGRGFTDPRIVASWLVDPPYVDYGHDPLRQWQLTISEIPRGESVVVNGYRGGEVTEPLATVVASETAPVAIEVVTDAETELVIDHTLGHASPDARLMQRWLVPTHVVEFAGRATALTAIDGHVDVLAAEHLVTVSTETGDAGAREPAAPPYSITLPSGKVAAVHGNQLVIGFPLGGAAARSLQQG